jgi:hypothetical protein
MARIESFAARCRILGTRLPAQLEWHGSRVTKLTHAQGRNATRLRADEVVE